MYFVLEGELEIRLDTKKGLTDADMKEMEIDLNLNSADMSKLLQMRLSMGLSNMFQSFSTPLKGNFLTNQLMKMNGSGSTSVVDPSQKNTSSVTSVSSQRDGASKVLFKVLSKGSVF